MSRLGKFILKAFILSSILCSKAYGEPDAAASCRQKLSGSQVESCKKAYNSAREYVPIVSETKDVRAGAQNLAANATVAQELNTDGLKKCDAVYRQCRSSCNEAGGGLKKNCDQYNAFAQELKTGVINNQTDIQAANATADAATGGGGSDEGSPDSGSGILNDPMMGNMLGAAIGAGLGYMLGKQKKDEHDPNDALLPNGQIDCSKPNAHKYSECNQMLEAKCMVLGPEVPGCKEFSDRYCGKPGSMGEGGQSMFCRRVIAHNFCKSPGREMCPSCLNFGRMDTPACKADPALCVAQNSPDQINEAKKSCPTDPVFSYPAIAGGTDGSGAVGTPVTGLEGGSGGSGSGGISSTPGSSTVGVTGDASADAGPSPAVAPSVGGPVLVTQSNDVAGVYSANLFSTSSQAFKAWCQTNNQSNCP